MGMLHSDWERLFKTRAKNRPFKAVDRFLRLYKESDGSFRIDRWVEGWGRDRSTRIYKPFATITENNICTFLADIGAGDHQGKNLVRKVAGFGAVWSSSKYRMYEHRLRFFTRMGESVPFTTGLAVDTKANKVERFAVDIKLKTDRTKSKPVYEFADKVVRMMELLIRIDGFTATDPSSHWRERYRALSNAKSLTMEDEKIVEVAELAYKEAAARAGVVPYKYWVYNNGQGHYVYPPEAEVKAQHAEKVLRLARRRLHAELKSRNNCYFKEVVSVVSK